MKHFLIVVFISLAANTMHAQNAADRITGIWYSKEKNSKVEIFKNTDNTYSGKIVWLGKSNGPDGKPLTDRKNPDPAKRTQKILGMTIISGLVFKNNEWKDGTIYAPGQGKYADCKAKIDRPDELTITASLGWFSKTNTWTRQ